MRALFVSNGVPAFWMTINRINPADTPHHGLIDSGLMTNYATKYDVSQWSISIDLNDFHCQAHARRC
jgi:hypothetical protein